MESSYSQHTLNFEFCQWVNFLRIINFSLSPALLQKRRINCKNQAVLQNMGSKNIDTIPNMRKKWSYIPYLSSTRWSFFPMGFARINRKITLDTA